MSQVPVIIDVLSHVYEHHYVTSEGVVSTYLAQDCRAPISGPFPEYFRLRVDGEGYPLGQYSFHSQGLLRVYRDELRVTKYPRLVSVSDQ